MARYWFQSILKALSTILISLVTSTETIIGVEANMAIARIISGITRRIGEYCRFSKKRKLEIEGEIGEWINLPDNAVWLIVCKLGDADRVRMRVVCKSWASIISQVQYPPQIPWLLLPHAENPKSMNFYDVSSDRIHEIRLPNGWFGSSSTKGWYCFGSSKGWLIMVDKSPHREKSRYASFLPKKDKFDIFLFNPVSGDQQQLPCLETIPAFNADFYNNNRLITDDPHNKVQIFIKRIILSSHDLSSCVVAAIFDDGRVLACCKPNDETWTVFEGIVFPEKLTYTDIIFSKKILYASALGSQKRKTVARSHTIKLSDDNCEVSLKLFPSLDLVPEVDNVEPPLLFDKFEIYTDNYECGGDYLIEANANGDIWLVRKRVHVFRPIFGAAGEIGEEEAEFIRRAYTGEYHKTKSFDVFKINLDKYTDHEGCTRVHLSRVESLDTGVLFLAATGSWYAKQAPQIERSDCIYFADDFLYYYRCYDPHVSRETGIYDLKNGKIQRPFPSIKLPRHSSMCWFTPNIRY